MTPSVFIIILNWNRQQQTLDCLSSIDKDLKVRGFKLRIVVVDNASTEGTLKTFENFKFKGSSLRIELVVNSSNIGYSGGNNAGIRYAMDQSADYVMILNNDTKVDTNLLIELLTAAKSKPQGGIFSPKIYFFKGSEFHKDRYSKSDLGHVIWAAGGKIDWQNMYGVNRGLDEVDTSQFDKLEQVNMASGCCILLTKKAITKLSGFDDRYFLYYEDVDLSIRAQKAGLQIWYVPTAKLWHRNAGSSGTGSDLHDYFITRNRLLAGLQFAPLRTKLALIRESAKLLFTGRSWQKHGVFDFYLNKFGKGSFPV